MWTYLYNIEKIIPAIKVFRFKFSSLKTATQQSNNGAQYQTASNNSELDAVIDSMISGAPLDRAQEQQAISAKWQLNQ